MANGILPDDPLKPGAQPQGLTPVAQGVATTGGQYDNPQRVVDAPRETVQGQVSGILAQDSPFLQQARTRAAQASNSKGLLNSSMATSAGEAAAYDAALPIANADAQTYKSAGDQNFSTQSQSRLMNQQARENLNVQSAISAQNYQQDYALQGLKGQQAKELADIEAQYKQFAQVTASSGQMFTQAMSDLKNILSDTNIPAENKQGIINSYVQMMKSALAVQGGINNLDLTGLLTFG